MSFEISLTNEQSDYPVDEQQLIDAAKSVLLDSTFSSAAISLVVVDDPTIHELNRQYLDHDWPTDVLSFVLEETDDHVEGEVIISADTAAQSAEEIGCSAAAEQMLYVIHGVLHLVGFRDKSAADAEEMRAAEAKFLRQHGFEPSVVTDESTDGTNGASTP